MLIDILHICIYVEMYLLTNLYYARDYDSVKTYRVFEGIANPFNKIMLSEYIYYEYNNKYGYRREENNHILFIRENTTLRINNYNIKIETDNIFVIIIVYLCVILIIRIIFGLVN